MKKRLFISDGELAVVLGVSQSTISRIVNGPISRNPNAVDLRKAESRVVGNARRWSAASVAKLLGITTDELFDSLA